jgi:hypothetical protein
MKKLDFKFFDGDDNARSRFNLPVGKLPFQDKRNEAIKVFKKERECILIGVLEKMFDKVPSEVEIANHCVMQMIEGTGHCMVFYEDQPVLEIRDIMYDPNASKITYSWNDLTGKE